MEKKLYRNEHDKVIAGISSGLADYMQIDITIVRILFVLSSIFLAGTGVLVYIVMWIIVPVNNDITVRYKKFDDYYKRNQGTSMFNTPNAFNNPYNSGEQTKWNTENVDPNKTSTNPDFSKLNKSNDSGRTIVGLVLLILGIYFLLRQLDFIPHWLNIFKIYKLWPLAIVAIGISLIFKNQNKNEWDTFKKTTEEEAQKTEEPQTSVQNASIVDEEGKSSEENTQI